MNKIGLTQNKFTEVDDADFEWLNQWKWYHNNGSAVRSSSNKKVYMHRVINDTPSDKYTDHIDGNRLNNRRANLRTCTNRENQRNSHIQVNNSSGYKGVYRTWGRWRARLFVDHKGIHGGTYDTPKEAALAYNKLALEHYGEFARLNKV